MVTVEVPNAVESSDETALTVTVPELVPGTCAGAIYRPFESIVPTVESPLAVSLTSQVTMILVDPLRVAVNCIGVGEPAFTETVAGDTVTTIPEVDPVVVVVGEVPLQDTNAARTTSDPRRLRRLTAPLSLHGCHFQEPVHDVSASLKGEGLYLIMWRGKTAFSRVPLLQANVLTLDLRARSRQPRPMIKTGYHDCTCFGTTPPTRLKCDFPFQRESHRGRYSHQYVRLRPSVASKSSHAAPARRLLPRAFCSHDLMQPAGPVSPEEEEKDLPPRRIEDGT